MPPGGRSSTDPLRGYCSRPGEGLVSGSADLEPSPNIKRRVAEMAKPALLVVDDERASLSSLTQELESRYGLHYRVVSSLSAREAVVLLEEVRSQGANVAVTLV